MKKTTLGMIVLALAVAQMAFAQEEGGRGRRGPGQRGRGGRGGILARMDKDGDGLISKDEYRGPEAMFTRLVENGDGSLDTGELRKMGKVHQEMLWENVDKDGLFSAIDANGDGVVTKDEFNGAELGRIIREAMRDAMQKAGLGGRGGEGKAKGAEAFKRMDKDGDGKLSRDEFPRPQVFDKIDKDADGFLDQEELGEAMRRMRERGGKGGRRGGDAE